MRNEIEKEHIIKELSLLLYRVARIENGVIIERDPRSAREFQNLKLRHLIGQDVVRELINHYLEKNEVFGHTAELEAYILSN